MDHVASLLLGLGNGGVFAALALALVLTYRSSGVLNFATGAIAMYVAYTYAGLRRGELIVPFPGLPKAIDLGGPMPFIPATAIALVIAAGLGALLYGLVFRPLRDAPPLARAVASIGVLLIIQALIALRVGVSPVSVRGIFPAGRWEFGDILVLSDRFYLALTIVALTAVLTLLLRYTRFGLLTRAAAESQTGAYVSGISPDRVAFANWMLSAVVAGIGGILIAPLSPLTPSTYTLFVVPALAAALVGGFQFLVPAVAAGFAIGMLQAEATSLAAKHDWMPASGSSELVPLLVILGTLLLTHRGLPQRGTLLRQHLGRAPRPTKLLLPTLIGSTVGVVAIVLTSGSWRAAVIATIIFAVIGLSFVVVTGYAGQVSVAQLSLAGCAAFSLSWFTNSLGLPFPLAPIAAALVATAVGVVIGLPALRVRGLMLGVVTLAFAYAIEAVWFRNTDIVSSSGAAIDDPSLFGLDLGVGTGAAFPRVQFGLMCLVVLVTVALGVAKLRSSRLGSAMLAVRANERSAAGLGVDVVRVKVISFAIASFIAGLGGSLLAYRRGVVTFDSFTALGGLALLATAYLAGVTSIYGGILAGIIAASGIVFAAFDEWVDLGEWFGVISAIAVVATVIFNPEGLAKQGHELAARLGRLLPARFVAGTRTDDARDSDTGDAPDAADPAPLFEPGAVVLDVTDLTVRYGGVTAVHDLSLVVHSGTVVGLIGPNGAGKTSAIDGITGATPSTGSVSVNADDVSALPTHRRVQRGLGRTFQSLELYDDLTVEENVAVAVSRGARPGAVGAALDRVGIGHLRERTAGGLSQGERQLVSIARAWATEPAVLLLDEPAAGLDTAETVWLGERIRDIAQSGVGVLLVDHDVALVLGVCDNIYVLDFGEVIASGDPNAIRSNPAVTAAYLGGRHELAETVE